MRDSGVNKGFREFDAENKHLLMDQEVGSQGLEKRQSSEEVVSMEEEDSSLTKSDNHEMQLTLEEENQASTVFYSVGEEGGRIGRHATMDISIPDSSVSREHAEIVCVHKEFLIRDIGSTGGTFIKIEGVLELQNVQNY